MVTGRGSDAERLIAAVIHTHAARRTDRTMTSRRCRDRELIDRKRRTYRMIHRNVREGVARRRIHIRTINDHAIDMVACGWRYAEGLIISIIDCNSPARTD